MKRKYFSLPGAFVGFAALLYGPSAALAQTAPALGVVQQFSALGGSGVTGSAGAGTQVTGDVGSFPTATISNFPPSSVVGGGFVLHSAVDGTVIAARGDANAAFVSIGLLNPGAGTVLASNLSLAPVLTTGVYTFVGGFADLPAGTTLTLSGGGVFIFKTASTAVFNVLSNVSFIGGANPCNVFWQVGSSATLNGISFGGNVFASASVTVGAGSNVTGRAIAGPAGAVTMAGAGGNTIGGCASPGFAPPVLPVPALPELAAWGLLGILLASGVFVIGRR